MSDFINLADELRQTANAPYIPPDLLARAAAEIERLRGGYVRILGLSSIARLERDEPHKIASEYV